MPQLLINGAWGWLPQDGAYATVNARRVNGDYMQKGVLSGKPLYCRIGDPDIEVFCLDGHWNARRARPMTPKGAAVMFRIRSSAAVPPSGKWGKGNAQDVNSSPSNRCPTLEFVAQNDGAGEAGQAMDLEEQSKQHSVRHETLSTAFSMRALHSPILAKLSSSNRLFLTMSCVLTEWRQRQRDGRRNTHLRSRTRPRNLQALFKEHLRRQRPHDCV